MDTPQPPRRTRNILPGLLLAPTIVYLLSIATWLIARTAFGDRRWWLFLLNNVTPYLIMPLALVMLPAMIARRWLIAAVSVLLFIISAPLLIDPWFRLPRTHDGLSAQGVPFRVMTFNINGGNDRPDHVIATIRAAQPDIIALQELNPAIAAALERELGEEYSYRFLDPQWGVTGMGIISRFPLRPLAIRLPGHRWIGTPQAVEIDTPGKTITLLNFHAIPPLGSRQEMTAAIGERERQAAAINAFVEAQRTPVVVAGDLNATPFHRAYHILENGALSNVWRTCGDGTGFTWPGADTFRRIPIPSWFVRIDYLFTTGGIVCLDASVGAWDGFPDHRAVVATPGVAEELREPDMPRSTGVDACSILRPAGEPSLRDRRSPDPMGCIACTNDARSQ
ncbi:MAG: endonuclease/exonuclease/phosphatase family protein [Roseiflexus sp.]